MATPAITEPLRAVGETLDTELKRWLDLNDEKNGALFAKAALALRNNNGGRLIIGVDDRTNAGITFPNPLGDIRQAFANRRRTVYRRAARDWRRCAAV